MMRMKDADELATLGANQGEDHVVISPCPNRLLRSSLWGAGVRGRLRFLAAARR